MNRAFYGLQRLTFIPLAKIFFRARFTGPPLPEEGPYIVAANHESFIDPVILQMVTKRRLHYMMISSYYFKPGLLNRYSRIMRCIPVMEGRQNREAIRSALEVLAAGRPVGIFPQGAIRPSGSLREGMLGTALLALKSGVPVFPARIRGTAKILPRGARFLRPGTIEVRLGEAVPYQAIDPGAYASRHDFLAAVTDSVMAAIRVL